MKNFLINNNSDNLLLFFTGWGCDEFEFKHIECDSDVLLLYDYSDLNLEMDFSKYKIFNLIAFSAGVFIASVINFDFEINKKFAIDGNPYLFDENLGLSKKMQEFLYNITEDTAEDFAKNYLVKTDAEIKNFHPSNRTIESCCSEFDNLKQIYEANKENINDFYDVAIFGQYDPIFNVQAQKKFFGERTYIIKNARHNPFFRIKNYEQIFDLTFGD